MREEGFTLVEALIALVILTAALASLQQGLGAGWKGLGLTRGERGALEVAQARLAAAGIETPLDAARQTGTTPDGYRWELSVQHQGEPTLTASRPKLAGRWVTAIVRWHASTGFAGERSVSLTTFKLGATP